jgi:hypothetical protein
VKLIKSQLDASGASSGGRGTLLQLEVGAIANKTDVPHVTNGSST